MSSMNGVLSPPPILDPSASSLNLSAKRKRENSNGLSAPDITAPPEMSSAQSRTLIKDLIAVLKEDDTTPSILTRSIPDNPSSNGPHVKRQKSVDSSGPQNSILSRLLLNYYENVDEVLDDIDAAVSDIVDKLELPNGATRNQLMAISSVQSEMSIKVAAFKKRARELVRREKASWERRHKRGVNGMSHSSTHNPMSMSGFDSLALAKNNMADGRMVLTLYGSAPVPKQLFSSLQKPTKVPGDKGEGFQPIREAGLPNGIATTRIIPTHPIGLTESKRRTQTLGDVFPTPANVASLLPPKPSKVATTRSSSVGWYHPASIDSVPRIPSYFKQVISSGQWIDYSNETSSNQNNKKTPKEKPLSLGGTKIPVVEPDIAEGESAKLDALFRSAYSSYAPTRDDAAAIAPTGLLDRIWWHHVGEKIYARVVDDFEADANSEMASQGELGRDDELKIFEEGLEELERDAIDPSLVTLGTEPAKSAEEKDVEEILEGISELLETLNSYQRIRHMSLNASSRPAGLLSATDTKSVGTPTKPSESEQITYEILKSQLSLMISSLPPYAVAKLDPDRLSDLTISTKIEVQINDYKGVMEEDESTSRAKMAASSSRATSQSIHRSSSSSAHYGNQFASQVRSASSQYFGQTQTPVRPPSTNMQRPPAIGPTPASYQGQRPLSASSYRSNAYGTPTYAHQAVRPVQQQYPASAQQSQYASTTPSQSYLRAPPQSYHQHAPPASQSSMNGRYTNQTPYSQQAQSSQNDMDYLYSNGNHVQRQMSPHKPMYSPQTTTAQPTSTYSSPTTATSQRPQAYVQNPGGQTGMNGSTVRPSQSQFPHQATGPIPYNTHLTLDQQQSLIQRQQVHLANQQQSTQVHSRSTAQAAIGSPSKTRANGSSPVPAGL